MEKILGFGVLIAVVIAIGAYAFPASVSKTVVQQVQGISSNDVTNTNFTQIQSTGGIIISNNIADVMFRANPPLTLATASTTICAIQNVNATTTLEWYAFTTTGSTTASSIVVGTTTTAFGTSSTPFVTSQTFAANAQGTINFQGSSNNAIISPNQWITLGATNGSASGPQFYASGLCSAQVRTVTAQ